MSKRVDPGDRTRCAVTKKLYWLLESGRLRSESGVRACLKSLSLLRTNSVRSLYKNASYGFEISWLAGALIQRKAIEPPVVPGRERACDCGQLSCFAQPKLLHVRWYYPIDVLIGGVERVYEEERAKESES